MPIYEYHCDACDHDFEEWHKHADDIQHVPCPECKSDAHRVISNTSFQLKGGGWYVTEYGNRKPDAASPKKTPKSVDTTPSTTATAAAPAPAAPAPSGGDKAAAPSPAAS